MTKVPSRLLVIDADVARSCGSSDRPPAPQCLAALDTVLDVGHRVLVTTELNAEWHRHAGRNKIFMRWFRQMLGRKRVIRVELSDHSHLTRKLVQFGVTEDEQAQIEKDVHLLAAALHGDQRIISQDERARRCFKRAAPVVVEISEISWVNPVNEAEGILAWLKTGAPIEKHRQLSHG